MKLEQFIIRLDGEMRYSSHMLAVYLREVIGKQSLNGLCISGGQQKDIRTIFTEFAETDLSGFLFDLTYGPDSPKERRKQEYCKKILCVLTGTEKMDKKSVELQAVEV
jgi:hypothetical protein